MEVPWERCSRPNPMETGENPQNSTQRHQRNREENQSNADGKGEQMSRQVCIGLLDVNEKPMLQITWHWSWVSHSWEITLNTWQQIIYCQKIGDLHFYKSRNIYILDIFEGPSYSRTSPILNISEGLLGIFSFLFDKKLLYFGFLVEKSPRKTIFCN